MKKPKTKSANVGLAKPAPTRTAKPAKRSAAPKKPAAAKSAPAPLEPFKGSVSHLIHRAEQCAGDIFARVAPSGVVTPRQYAILEEIDANPGISQTGLVDRTGIDRSTLADIVRRMLDKGLVQRERTPEDARAYAVKLTRKGANTLKRMQPVAEKVDKQLLDAIPKEHRDTFVSVLAQMVASLSDDEDSRAA
jgi:DNA-binding MarR family transcriptional regulator